MLFLFLMVVRLPSSTPMSSTALRVRFEPHPRNRSSTGFSFMTQKKMSRCSPIPSVPKSSQESPPRGGMYCGKPRVEGNVLQIFLLIYLHPVSLLFRFFFSLTRRKLTFVNFPLYARRGILMVVTFVCTVTVVESRASVPTLSNRSVATCALRFSSMTTGPSHPIWKQKKLTHLHKLNYSNFHSLIHKENQYIIS